MKTSRQSDTDHIPRCTRKASLLIGLVVAPRYLMLIPARVDSRTDASTRACGNSIEEESVEARSSIVNLFDGAVRSG